MNQRARQLKPSATRSARGEGETRSRDDRGSARSTDGGAERFVAAPPQAPIARLFEVLSRRWAIVVVCTVLVPAAALAFSLSQEEEYTASAALLFRDPGFDQQLFGTAAFPLGEDPQRAAETNLELVSLDAVADRTAAAIDRPGVTGGYVAAHTSVSERGQSDIVDVVAEDPDPELAALLATTFVEQYILFRKDADRSRIREAERLVQSQIDQLSPTALAGPEGQRLVERVQELRVLASLQTGNAELVQAAHVPDAPSSPKTRRNVAIGLILGLLLGMTLAFLREQLDRRLRSADEAQRITGLPVLASVPHSSVMSGRRDARLRQPEAANEEAFRMLRANLRYFNVDRSITSLLATSAAPQEGKTTVCWNLALAEAQGGRRVLLIEADLRRPTLAKDLSVAPRGGLSLLLTGSGTLADAVMPVADVPRESMYDPPDLDILFAGPIPPNPAELIESQRMEELLATSESTYDLVIIDSPPTPIVSDTIPLVRLVSGVLVVTRIQQTTSDALTGLAEQLDQLAAPVLGMVANDGTVPESTYYDRQRQHL